MVKKLVLCGYLVIIHVTVGVAVLKGDLVSTIDGWLRPLAYEVSAFHERMVGYHQRIDEHVSAGIGVFIGDSHIQGLAVDAVYSPSVNYGIGGDTTVGVLKRIPAYRSVDKASFVLVAAGVNDIRIRGSNEIVNNLLAIRRSIPETTPVLIGEILPVSNSYFPGYNAVISETNALIRQSFEGVPNTYLIGVPPDLVSESGELADDYHSGDGIHLNFLGREILIRNLRQALDSHTPCSGGHCAQG